MSIHSLEIEKLYDAEHGRLRALVRRIVGNSATAEDVVQQAFLNLLGRVAPPGSAYITKAARNLALNHLRDSKRRSQIEIYHEQTELIADNTPSPEIEVMYRNELRRLLEAVAALPERRRQAFVLNRIEGLTYDEVAWRMGISRNTVISQIVSALAELDRLL